VSARIKRLATPAVIVVGAVGLRLLAGVGFVNYDTLYALAWGGQLARGSTPTYGVPVAPTPHPLIELLGLILEPLGAHAAVEVTIALAFLALSACGWVIYALGACWFSRATGALAALLFVTRVPVLSYGVRAYIDLPYVGLVLGALLVESRRRRAGAPVLALLALAGLMRPEAWVFSGLYWLYLFRLIPRLERPDGGLPRLRWPARERQDDGAAAALRRARLGLTLLAFAAPLVWVVSDLAITGQPLWSLTNTRHTAQILDRVTGIANVPEYIPRRIGEIVRPPVLVGAALGGVLSLLWLRPRARIGAVAGVIAVLVFALFATLGLPINTRYAFLAAAILCIFCGVGVFGWSLLARDDPRRGWWLVAGAVVLVGLLAYAPSQYRAAHSEMNKLAREQSIEDDLVALVRSHAIGLVCGPVGVPNHAPIPLLSLYLKTSPANVVSAQVHQITHGVYLDPASVEVERDYVLDPHDPHLPVSVPPGFRESATNRSWLVFEGCG
jgi:hypothetical protein